MNGADVLVEVDGFRPQVEPFLAEGEQLQAVLRASSRPAKAIKLAAMEVWPFFAEKAKFLLVATDRRWLVLESTKEGFTGSIDVRGEFDRKVRVQTSWLTRFDGFDQPYSIDPIHELCAVAANDALDALEAGRPWSLEQAAPTLTAEDDDRVADALSDVVMKVGRFIPRRPGARR